MPPKVAKKKPFRFQARYVLLTYAQCGDLDHNTIVERIESLDGECVIGRELHQDGGLHLHAFVDFRRKFRSSRTDIFDVGNVHPNVSVSYGTPEKGWDYAVKDGDVVYEGLARPSAPTRGNLDGESDSAWHQIYNAESRDQFWQLLSLFDPRAAVINHTQCAKFADWKFDAKPAVYEDPPGVRFIGGETDGRREWVLQSRIGTSSVGQGGRVKSLVLWGCESLTGKTTWARSLGNHIYCLGLVSGDRCMGAPDVEYAVFDDIRGGMKFFPSFKEWLGCQANVTVKVLHREPKLLPWNKPSIWCANKDPRLEMDWEDRSWMEQNCTFINVEEKIVEFD